ncbi:trypsin inhibitor like cysteine rich domain-containing protein [Ditylenchus destructor]|nr:trypsin inhibitor like cysteine rich domain-containing protein [Ditylenchus destructor]
MDKIGNVHLCVSSGYASLVNIIALERNKESYCKNDGEVYAECAPGCEPSCENPSPGVICELECQLDSCTCEDGLLRAENGKCVIKGECNANHLPHPEPETK